MLHVHIHIDERISQGIIILWVNTINVLYFLISSKSLVEEIPMQHATLHSYFVGNPLKGSGVSGTLNQRFFFWGEFF